MVGYTDLSDDADGAADDDGDDGNDNNGGGDSDGNGGAVGDHLGRGGVKNKSK